MKDKGLKIAVLSGKGGTGKTLVSVNLAAAAGRSVYIDCDVEEPDGHLFFKPHDIEQEDVAVKMPAVDAGLCDGCRKCVAFCRFNALAFIARKPVVFEEVCHSCGGCALVCPRKAINERPRPIGKIQKGLSGGVEVRTGILNTGEASGVPVIRQLLRENTDKAGKTENGEEKKPVFIDCPPGSACVVMESIRDADYCILVAEPTIFGVHNLNMVYELVRLFNKPFGVVLNKDLEGEENPAESFCEEKQATVLCRIPFDKELGALSSNARIAARESDRFRTLFGSLLEKVRKEARHEAVVNP